RSGRALSRRTRSISRTKNRSLLMKLSIFSVFACAALVLGVAGLRAAAADQSDKPAKKEDAKKEDAKKPINTKCPVQGDDIDPDVTTTYKGKTVAFCCKDCIKDFKKDPEKYMKQIAADNKKQADEAKKGDKGKKPEGKSEGKSAEKSDSQAAGKAATPVNKFCLVHTDDAVDPT